MIKIGNTIYSKGNDPDFSEAFTEESSIASGRIELNDGKTWLEVATVIDPKLPPENWEKVDQAGNPISDKEMYLSKDYAGVKAKTVLLDQNFDLPENGGVQPDYQINAQHYTFAPVVEKAMVAVMKAEELAKPLIGDDEDDSVKLALNTVNEKLADVKKAYTPEGIVDGTLANAEEALSGAEGDLATAETALHTDEGTLAAAAATAAAAAVTESRKAHPAPNAK